MDFFTPKEIVQIVLEKMRWIAERGKIIKECLEFMSVGNRNS